VVARESLLAKRIDEVGLRLDGLLDEPFEHSLLADPPPRLQPNLGQQPFELVLRLVVHLHGRRHTGRRTFSRANVATNVASGPTLVHTTKL
jgi:hypothetical protein